MMKKVCIAALILLATALLIYAYTKDASYTEGENQISHEGETDMYGYHRPRRITASQARARMQSYPDAIILDVRTQQEFDTGHIPGAILLPDYAIEAQAPYVLPDKDAMILIYCRSGNRSASAARLLVSMGYTNVYDFGGINSWPYEVE